MKTEDLKYILETLEYGLSNCSDDNSDTTTHFNRFQNSIDLVERELNKTDIIPDVMRYFFITFNGNGVGAIWFNADGFPSHKQMLDAIKTKYPEMTNPVVTGIKELSEKDYNSLCA